MSNWLYVSGYMVVSDYLPCKIGKKYTIDGENDLSPSAELCGYNVSTMLGSVLVSLRQRWAYYHDKSYNPFNYQDRILWKIPIVDDNGSFIKDEEDEEWIKWDEMKIGETPFLKVMEFPCGSEGPLDLTITPHIDEWGTSWHIVFNGNLRDRDSSYIKHIEEWWKVMQLLLNVESGYIVVEGQGKKWKNAV